MIYRWFEGGSLFIPNDAQRDAILSDSFNLTRWKTYTENTDIKKNTSAARVAHVSWHNKGSIEGPVAVMFEGFLGFIMGAFGDASPSDDALTLPDGKPMLTKL